MLEQRIKDALNQQLNYELYSAYLYISMAAYFDNLNLKGFANWMQVQVQEELVHAKKIYTYLNSSGAKVELSDIKASTAKWGSTLAVFETTYQHECGVTKKVHALFKLAHEADDYATVSFLKWFVDEQVEEEANSKEIVDKLKLIGADTSALFLLNQELGARVFTPTAQQVK